LKKTILLSILSMATLAGCASSMPMNGGMVDDHETTIAKCGVGNYTFRVARECGPSPTPSPTPVTTTATTPTSTIATMTGNAIEISKEITFKTGSAKLTAEGKAVLDEVAKVVLANTATIGTLEVAGHTDTTGNPTKNMALSEARANTVMLYLASKGIDSGKMTAKGFGQTKPKFDPTTATKSQRAANRRVEFTVETTSRN
jgi:outer membrane protein OmpA-like peptidoglycan-associated protein